MNLESAQTLPTLFNRFLGSASLAVILGLSVVNIGAVEEAISNRVGTIHEIEVLGSRMTFDASDIQKTAPPIANFTRGASEQVAKDINQLDQRTVIRLLYVGTFSDLCLFNTSNSEWLDNAATDYRLDKLGLVKLTESATLKEAILKKPRDPALGNPITCYTTELTARGQDAKTVITQMLGAAFSKNIRFAPSEPAKAEPAPESKAPVPGPSAANPSKVSKPQKLATLRK